MQRPKVVVGVRLIGDDTKQGRRNRYQVNPRAPISATPCSPTKKSAHSSMPSAEAPEQQRLDRSGSTSYEAAALLQVADPSLN